MPRTGTNVESVEDDVRMQLEAEMVQLAERMVNLSAEILMARGYIVCAPDSAPMPKNLAQAQGMNLLSEKYIQGEYARQKKNQSGS